MTQVTNSASKNCRVVDIFPTIGETRSAAATRAATLVDKLDQVLGPKPTLIRIHPIR